MFKNLYTIMSLEGLTLEGLSKILGMHRNTLNNKLSGESEFSLLEAEKIQTLFNKYKWDYIFYRDVKTA